ncbi:hypothetical protein KY285_016611 [Solanum tuberosum]|nr:hypothetical protein KY284_016620 [Solanum tuberosum]KAH0702333.1 hypothetical protein KY285_016611 [Solanum tuberosum]
MGRLFVLTLEGKIYSCKHCGTHLALSENIVSKSFHCRHGKAYLFSKVRLPMRRAKNTKKENQCLRGQWITLFFRIELGTYHKSSLRYFLLYLNRFKISGPDGSHYWASHETHVAGSDADDV